MCEGEIFFQNKSFLGAIENIFPDIYDDDFRIARCVKGSYGLSNMSQ